VHVNGLGLTIRVNVENETCKCKNKYIYIILCSSIKQCKKCDFLLEEGRFYNVFDDKLTKWPIAKGKKSIKIYTHN
jgi:hypothetical protein